MASGYGLALLVQRQLAFLQVEARRRRSARHSSPTMLTST
jgi:hypothetical protein